MSTLDITRFNEMQITAARSGLLACCECEPWVEALLRERPFKSAADLLDRAAAIWFEQPKAIMIETFNRKPRIGDLEQLRKKFSGPAWDSQEQAGVAGAEDEVLRGLVEGNEAYLRRFAFIFIIFATGKSAAEMLAALQARLSNDPQTELQTAAEENHKITTLRLYKWLGEVG